MSERNRCARCNELLHPDREVWLELDQRTETYTDSGDVPENKSQGGFPFGRACAKRALSERDAKFLETAKKVLEQHATTFKKLAENDNGNVQMTTAVAKLRERFYEIKAAIKPSQELKETFNSSVDKKLRRYDLNCSLCPPNRQENAGRTPKHGEKKSKRKNKRV